MKSKFIVISSIELIKIFKVKKDIECTFHPKINKTLPNLIFEGFDKNTQKYLERVKISTKNQEINKEKYNVIKKSNLYFN